MIPSPKEIKTGQEAIRLIEAYEKRKRLRVGAYIRDILTALLVAFGLCAMGATWLALVSIPLWLFPRILTDCLLQIRFQKDLTTIKVLREKYGAAIDSELQMDPRSSTITAELPTMK